MRTLVIALLSVALVATAVPAAYVVFSGGSEDPVPAGSTTPPTGDRASGSSGAEDVSSDGQPTAPGSGSAADSGSADASSTAESIPRGAPLLQPSRTDASPMEMVEDLLGPAPEALELVDGDLPLAQAMAQHPAFPDAQTPELPAGTAPWTNALSRIVQAHGILAETMEKASQGDEDAHDLLPYATAQLAAESQRSGEIFDTASTLLDLQAQSSLDLHRGASEVPVATDLEREVNRLYRLIGLPDLPVEQPASNEAGLASLVRATTDLVDATRMALTATSSPGSMDEQLAQVDRALSDGTLTPAEATMISEVATMVHQTTVQPLQTRLDALNVLFHTSREVLPTLTLPASHEPTHPPEELPEPPEETPEPPEETPEPPEEVPELPEEVPELPEGPGGLPTPSPGIGCVDPLCAITILDGNDTHVNGSEEPLPIAIPGIGQVDSLFPQRPLLVLDQGGNDTYTDLPHTRGFDQTVNRTGEQEVEDEDLPVDVEDQIDGLPSGGSTLEGVTDTVKGLTTDAYSDATGEALGLTDIDARFEAQTPLQVVIDLGGNDRYEGERAAAYAAGGGLAAIIDADGDDVYQVDRGIGMLEGDGLAIVLDLAGDDRYIADIGAGSMLPLQDGFDYRIGGLGALVDFQGNDTYRIGEMGIGVGIKRAVAYPSTSSLEEDRPSLLPIALPVALDLAGPDDDGFQPRAGDFAFEPNVAVQEEGTDNHLRLWDDRRGPPGLFSGGIILDDPPSELRDATLTRIFAAHRTYEAGMNDLSEGTMEVNDHNLTIRPASSCPTAPVSLLCLAEDLNVGLEGHLHNGIHVQLTGEAQGPYEPPHPLILVDATGNDNTYIDANPYEQLFNETEDEDGAAIVVGGGDGAGALLAGQPLLILDTGGNDAYTGDTAHLDTARLGLPFSSGTNIPSQAAAVIVDADGDDTYTGNVSSSLFNTSHAKFGDAMRVFQLATLLFDGGGTDTIQGDLVAGTLLRNAGGSQTDQQVGSSALHLLLLGTQDTTGEERNTITAGPGSVAGIRIDRDNRTLEDLDTNDEGGINGFEEGVDARTRALVGAVVTAPTTYDLGHHSLASVEWCDRAENQQKEDDEEAILCPIDGPASTAANAGQLHAYFLGSPGDDIYHLDDNEGLGNVTFELDPQCPGGALGGFDVPAEQPRFVTRFIDIGGADSYLMDALAQDLPAWRNDHAWVGYPCQESGTLETAVGPLGADSEDGTGLDRAVISGVDTLAIDNLAQYVLGLTGSASNAALAPVEENIIELEAPRLCASDFGNNSGLAHRGNMWCAFNTTEKRQNFLKENPLQATDRIIINTTTTTTVPANLWDEVNPCDVTSTEEESTNILDLSARSNNPAKGNPLAAGVSGCWATLEIRPTNPAGPTSPIWERLGPDAGYEDPNDEEDGWLDIMAGPVRCGQTNESLSIPVIDPLDPIGSIGNPVGEAEKILPSCSTDAFPVPFHVDGTEGHNNGRWLLPEGDYEYRVTFNGPITMLRGGEKVLGPHELTLEHDPLAHYDTSDRDEIPNIQGTDTEEVPGLLTWLKWRGQELTEATGPEATILDGIWVNAVDQSSAGAPEEVQVVSPFKLESHADIGVLLCHAGTPYRGTVNDGATSTWLNDVGLWSTVYELERWGDDDDIEQPDECRNRNPTSTSIGSDGSAVELGLYDLREPDSPELIELPESRLDTKLSVDKQEPLVDIGPFRLSTGQDLDTFGIGVEDVQNRDILRELRRMTSGDPLGQPVHLELPIRVTDDAPIAAFQLGGVGDQVWEEATLPYEEDDNGDVVSALTLEFRDKAGEDQTVHCNNPETDICEARVNLTRAGKSLVEGEDLWVREVTMNVTLRLDDGSNGADDLKEAVRRSVVANAPITMTLPGGFEAVDEAGEVTSETGDLEIFLDLHRPTDVPLPCDGQGRALITSEPTAELITWGASDDIEGFLVQRAVDDRWVTLDFHFLDETTQANRECAPESGGEWSRFVYEPVGAHFPTEGNETAHELRTLPIDKAGNLERSPGAFEISIIFDRKAPDVSVRQVASQPDGLTLEVNASEPVTLSSADLVTEDGTTVPPLRLPTVQASTFELVYGDLAPNTTFEAAVEVADRVAHVSTATVEASTAKTLNLSLTNTPEVVGDSVTLTWAAGALDRLSGGNPSVTVTAQAIPAGEQEPCIERVTSAFIQAPLDDPTERSIELPLTQCPGGELSLRMAVENGPADAPLEQITLETKSNHDVEPPVPDLKFSGPRSESGWFTGPVTLRAIGEDDTKVVEAKIVTSGGTVDKLKLSRSGAHEVTVQATDAAGRTAEETFRVLVDLQAPTVHLISQDTLPAESRLLTVLVQADDDASGIRSIRTQQADGSWGPWSPVVEDMQIRVDIQDIDVLVAEVRDRAGHVARAALPVTTLADAPTVTDASVQALGPGTIEVLASLDRPLALEARALIDGRTVTTARSDAGIDHQFTLHPVTPGQEVQVLVDALLSDGSSVPVDELSTQFTMPGDGGPPTAPTDLSADLLEDGTVELSWAPAQDDAGIDQYIIRRLTGDVVTNEWAQEDTQLLDDPSAGETHTYMAQAIDLGGRTGAWSQAVSVSPERGLQLITYEISPEVATAGEPIQATLVLEAGQAPEDVRLALGDREEPMRLQEAMGDRFVYTTNLTLPASDTFFPEGLQFHVDDQVFPEQGTLPAPLVKSVAEVATETTEDAPAPALLGLLVTLVSAALLRRRWHS